MMMKSKQAPILAITLLVALAGGVVFYGAMNRPVSEEDLIKIQQESNNKVLPQAGESRETIPKENLASGMQQASNLPTPKMADKPGADGLSPYPTILKANQTLQKQKPSDSDLHPQWYREESGATKGKPDKT